MRKEKDFDTRNRKKMQTAGKLFAVAVTIENYVLKKSTQKTLITFRREFCVVRSSRESLTFMFLRVIY